jgi:hypothetical protein
MILTFPKYDNIHCEGNDQVDYGTAFQGSGAYPVKGQEVNEASGGR